MENYISKISHHVYAKCGAEAVKLYKEAFRLEESGKPWLDDEGLIIHQELLRNGEHFLSVSDDKHLPDGFIKKYPGEARPIMLFYVYFRNEDELRRTYELLYEEGNLCTGIQAEASDVVCDLIDKFGVFWHLRVPEDWEAAFIPK